MAKFKAFKPQAMERIARSMGYSGDMGGFQQYLDSNVSLKQRMKQLEDSAIEMADAGVVRLPTQTQQQPQDTIGGFVEPPKQTFQQGGIARPAYTGDMQFGSEVVGLAGNRSNVPYFTDNTNLEDLRKLQQYYSDAYKRSSTFSPFKRGYSNLRQQAQFKADQLDPIVRKNKYLSNMQGAGPITQYYRNAPAELFLQGQGDALSKFVQEAQAKDQPEPQFSKPDPLDPSKFNKPEIPRLIGQEPKVPTLKRLEDSPIYEGFRNSPFYNRTQIGTTAMTTGGINVPGLSVTFGGSAGASDFTDYVKYLESVENMSPQEQAKLDMRTRYEAAVVSARKQRAGGFMGRVVLPGEMDFNRFKEGKEFQDLNQGQLQTKTPIQQLPSQPQQPITEAQPIQSQIPTTGTAQPLPQQFIPQQTVAPGKQIQELMAQQAQVPALPTGATIVPQGTLQEQGQMIDPSEGQVTGAIQTPIAQATTAVTQTPMVAPAAQIAPATTQQNIKTLQAEAQQGASVPVVSAQTANASSIANLNAAQGTSIEMQNPVQRQIQAGEIISPSANAQTAAQFVEQIQVATATPSQQATVQGQLAGMMQQFEDGNTPAWAAGAIRAANHAMI